VSRKVYDGMRDAGKVKWNTCKTTQELKKEKREVRK
jgi:hypothetical protein